MKLSNRTFLLAENYYIVWNIIITRFHGWVLSYPPQYKEGGLQKQRLGPPLSPFDDFSELTYRVSLLILHWFLTLLRKNYQVPQELLKSHATSIWWESFHFLVHLKLKKKKWHFRWLKLIPIIFFPFHYCFSSKQFITMCYVKRVA